YVGSVAGMAAVVLLLPLLVLVELGVGGWSLAAMAVVGLLPAIDAALMLVNRLITGGFGATLLPGLALRDGLPPELRTMVATPILVPTRAAIDEQISRLEVHYLSTPAGEIYFALLSGWTDAHSESTPEDEGLLAAVTEGITRLNARYPNPSGADRFFLLHRRRGWNEAQGRWIGWERKRGKLHELNHLLRGSSETSFLEVSERSLPSGVRYVVTLDSDTRLPRDTISRLVGKMAHPLNR